MKVVFVVGPTASGKSGLALNLAEKFNAAIVNCDSIQLYQGVKIGSAMPSFEDQKRVPHFLYEIAPTGSELTVGDYHRKATELFSELEKKFSVIFVVGGTGFYFQALEHGLYHIGAADPEITSQLEKMIQEPGGGERLYQELLKVDPESAAKISVNDHYRIVRALEIYKTHGRTRTQIEKSFQEQKKEFPYPLLKIGLTARREILEPKVRLRTEAMLKMGLIPEVQDLLVRGFEKWSVLRSIGYKEVLSFLKGEISDQNALKEEIIKNTLRLAKRQRTWFQRDSEIHWLLADDHEKALSLVSQFLA